MNGLRGNEPDGAHPWITRNVLGFAAIFIALSGSAGVLASVVAPASPGHSATGQAFAAKKKCKKKNRKQCTKKGTPAQPTTPPVTPPVVPVTPPVSPAGSLSGISINDQAVAETDSGTTQASFTVSLSAASSQQVQVTYQTANGSAIAPDDYAAQGPTILSFDPGQTAKPVTVQIAGDRLDELDEAFSVGLSAPQNATITDAQGTATITDNDPGVLNETGVAGEADFCRLQSPASTTATPGQPTELIFGRIFETGVTEPLGGASGVSAEVGLGPSATDPRTALGWTFTATTFNTQVTNEDEYAATLTAPGTPGTYAYGYRFSLDGGANVTYCDLNGAGSGADTFETNQLGVLTVNP